MSETQMVVRCVLVKDDLGIAQCVLTTGSMLDLNSLQKSMMYLAGLLHNFGLLVLDPIRCDEAIQKLANSTDERSIADQMAH